MNRLNIVLTIVIISAMGAIEAMAAPSILLKALPGTVRVRPEGAVEGADVAELACARGEYESVQIVVTAADGNLDGCDAVVSEVKRDDGTAIPEKGVALYREVFVPVRHSAPRATCAPGLVPDPLVPFRNPYTGELVHDARWREEKLDGGRFGAVGFDVWKDQHQPLWLDVYVPAETPAGTYTGTVTVRARDIASAQIPVKLTVWDFVLPPGPTHENSFGGFHYVAQYLGLATDSEAYYTLEDRYIESMAAHRINPPLPARLLPKVAEDGTAQFDAETDRKITEFVDRYHVTNICVPNASGDKAPKFFRSWMDYLKGKGWLGRAYLYMLDEPNDAAAYEEVRKTGALVHEAAPELRRLVVEQPYTQDASWDTLDGAIDIWCPLFSFVHEPSVQRVQAQGNAVWSYTALVQTAPPYDPEYEQVRNDNPPFWQLDFPVTSYRIAPWLNRRYGITGLLYWQTTYWASPNRNPWDDPGFRIRWNGDGFLFYPGQDAGIEGPVASIRLKNLRDGMEDYEYFVILEQRGGKQAVDEAVRAAVPTWGSWDQDPYHLLDLRRRIAEEIVRRGQ